MRALVKIGGAALVSAAERASVAGALTEAREAGHELVVVHGGGPCLDGWCSRLGLDVQRVEGLRVTGPETAEVALAVLGGAVNRHLVAALCAAGAPAVGLSGADGGLIGARPHPRSELVRVGEVERVDPSLIETLLAAGFLPVVASLAPLAPSHAPKGQGRGNGQPAAAPDHPPFHNINADSLVAPLAQAIAAEAVLLLTDVPAVLDRRGRPLASIDHDTARRLTREGALRGGMLPKIAAALACASRLPLARVRIASAAGPGSILAALTQGGGTEVLPSPGLAHDAEVSP